MIVVLFLSLNLTSYNFKKKFTTDTLQMLKLNKNDKDAIF